MRGIHAAPPAPYGDIDNLRAPARPAAWTARPRRAGQHLRLIRSLLQQEKGLSGQRSLLRSFRDRKGSIALAEKSNRAALSLSAHQATSSAGATSLSKGLLRPLLKARFGYAGRSALYISFAQQPTIQLTISVAASSRSWL